MNLWLKLILATFACYRLAQLIAIDGGPYSIFVRFRLWAGRKAMRSPTRQTFAELITCPFCLGIWLAIPLTAIVVWKENLSFWYIGLIFLAISGGQTFLQEQSKDSDR